MSSLVFVPNDIKECKSSVDYIRWKYKTMKIDTYNLKKFVVDEVSRFSCDTGVFNDWLSGVSIHPEKVPFCKTCKSDTENFKLLTDLSLFDFESSIEKDKRRHMQCSKFCLWYEWFHMLRQHIESDRRTRNKESARIDK